MTWLRLWVIVVLISGCTKATYEGSASSEASPVPTPPPLLLLSVSPADGASGVPVDTHIEVVFSRAPDPATVTPLTFVLTDEVTGAPISGSVTGVPGDTARFVFTPTAALDAPTHPYRIDLLPCIAAADGARLDFSLSPLSTPCRFTTGNAPDTEPPYFFYYAHEATAVSPTAITLSWFAAIDREGGSPWNMLTYAIFVGESEDTIDFSHARVRTAPGVCTITVGGLTPNTTYYFVIRPVDEAGNMDSNTVTVSAHTFLAEDETELTLLYTADVFSTLEPCG